MPDVLAFDAPRRVIYVAAGSGLLSAFLRPILASNLSPKGDVGLNAHAVAVDPDTGHIYLPIANLGGQPVLREISVASSTGGDDNN